jgi:PhnB protein
MLPGQYQHPQGFFVTLTLEDKDRAREIFDALAATGDVQVPFQETFWSPGFGVVIDQFEVPWEINASRNEGG